jgi:FlaA1/EpsC-like NDP-sugar epimerase
MLNCSSCTLTLYIFVIAVVLKLISVLRWKFTPINFDGKVVFISGGSSGIGEQLTKDFVRLGAAKVIIASRRLEELQRV